MCRRNASTGGQRQDPPTLPKPLCTRRFACRSVMNHLQMRNLHALPDAARLRGFLLSCLNQLPKVLISNRAASPLPNFWLPSGSVCVRVGALWMLSRFGDELSLEEVQSEQWVGFTIWSTLEGGSRSSPSTRNTNHTDKILSIVLLPPPPVSLHRLSQTPPFYTAAVEKAPPLKTI